MTGGERQRGKALMVQGTGSDVGKSMVVAGLCRVAVRRGLRVAPFKAQNMSNNAAIAALDDGSGAEGEIGRAQALQAIAAGVSPTVHMNPVLIKPESDRGAQVVVHGRVRGHSNAERFGARRDELLAAASTSFERLRSQYDLVLVEGAGSASEVNLRARDIANMGFAEAHDLPVILLGDIDRGGVIAAIVGTCAVLPPDDRRTIVGTIINKFRGAEALFAPALEVIEQHTGWPNLGILPWLASAALLPEEDAASARILAPLSETIRVVTPLLPRIANFDDLDALAHHPGVSVTFAPPGTVLPECDLIVLPGSKNTRAELQTLRAEGWDVDIRSHYRRGGAIVGLCGGYQMLGTVVDDPDGTEDAPGRSEGLGLLNVETRLLPEKTTRHVHARDRHSGAPVSGYEIHVGVTSGPDRLRPMLDIDGAPEGACSPDGLVMGTYVHGLFDSDAFRDAFLARLTPTARSGVRHAERVQSALDDIADAMEAHLDIDRLLALAR